MNQEVIQHLGQATVTRLAELDQLLQQQKQRLANAQSEMQAAEDTIHRIEGARTQCQWHLQQLAQPIPIAKAEQSSEPDAAPAP